MTLHGSDEDGDDHAMSTEPVELCTNSRVVDASNFRQPGSFQIGSTSNGPVPRRRRRHAAQEVGKDSQYGNGQPGPIGTVAANSDIGPAADFQFGAQFNTQAPLQGNVQENNASPSQPQSPQFVWQMNPADFESTVYVPDAKGQYRATDPDFVDENGNVVMSVNSMFGIDDDDANAVADNFAQSTQSFSLLSCNPLGWLKGTSLFGSNNGNDEKH